MGNTAAVEDEAVYGGPDRQPSVEDVAWGIHMELTRGPGRSAVPLWDFLNPPCFDGTLRPANDDPDAEANGPWDRFPVIATTSGGNAKRFLVTITEVPSE